MKIRTQLLITVLLFGCLVAAVSTSAIITNNRAGKSQEERDIASGIAEGAGELNYLANDFLIYGENQQLERWQTRFVSFSGDVAALQAASLEQQGLVRNIQENTQRLKDVFDSVASGLVSSPRSQNGTIDQGLLRVSWSRLAIQSQGLVSDASRLSQLLDDQADQLLRTNMVIVIALIGIFGAYFAVNYLMIQRRALKGIARLQSGSAIIGAGNLDFLIEEKGSDEIGDLSRAFNRMAAGLRNVTASKRDLEREVTERKKTEEALMDSEARSQALIRYAPTGIYEVDYRGPSFLSVNDAVCILTGYTREELFAIGPAGLLEDDSRRTFADRIARQTAGEKIEESVEYRVRKKDGSTIFATLNVSFSKHRPGTALVIAHDVTDRRRMEQELRESEERYRTIVEVANEGIMIADTSGTITYVNPRMAAMLGYSADEMQGRSGLDFADPSERAGSADRIKKRKQGITEEYDLRFRHKNGDEVWLHASGTPLCDRGGAHVGNLGMYTDITRRKRAEEDLQRNMTELEAFAYSVSHDLREPLRTMDGFSQALMEEYADRLDATGEDYLTRIRGAAQHMAQITEGMLKLSGVIRCELQLQKVDLSGIASSIAEELVGRQKERNVEFVIAKGIVVSGDASLLLLALRNLFENSWKFTAKCRQARIEFGITYGDGQKSYFVKDNGVGFDMKYADKLFQPFQRLHSDVDYQGTGIGLATVQRVIRRHAGEVWAESHIGQGTTIHFTLSGERR